MPADDASPSSTDAVPGFRLERQLGERTWEATQLELNRRVALRRLEPGTAFDASAWPQRPGVVALYAAVDTPAGTYLAMRFVPGARTLAELSGARAGRRRCWLDEAAATLAGGGEHGDLTAHDILIDGGGHALVTGFGRSAGTDDAAAIEALRPAPPRRWPLALPPAAAAVVAAVVLVGGDGDGGSDGGRPQPPRIPAVASGATALGSDLGAPAVETIDCEGNPPSGSSLDCTVMQAKLPGSRLVAPFNGIVRQWVVRGAVGRVKLQVLLSSGKAFVAFNRGRTVTITDPDQPLVVRADLSVPKGAVFALEVAPGSGVGVRRVAGAATAAFFGPVRSFPALPNRGDGGGQELQLRVDLVPRLQPGA